MRTIIHALGALALAGCASSPPAGPAITFDACDPLEVVPPPGATADQLASLSDAVALWRAVGVAGLAAGGEAAAPAEAAPSVALAFRDAADPFYGYYDAPDAILYVNDRLTDRTERAIVIAHELGHAFGLVHVSDHPSVMNPGNLTVAPNAADQAALAALWGACPASP